MAKCRKRSHTVSDIKYYFVWITKYRDKVLEGSVAFRLRELFLQGSIPGCLHCSEKEN